MNTFTAIASNMSPRVARLVARGAAVLQNRTGRPPSEIELLNIRRKAEVVEWNERTMVVPEREATGVVLALPEQKLANRFVMPADNWFHIAPVGDHPHPKGLVQVIDKDAIDKMVSNFRQQKASDPNFPGLLVDYDHVSQGGSTEAAGWIQNLDARQDGLYANIKWSDGGKEAVEGGKYRLVSPVWKRSKCVDLGDDRCRPIELDSLALTNDPNLKGLKPLSR